VILRLQSLWCTFHSSINSCTSAGVPKNESSYIHMGKKCHCPWSPTHTESIHTMCCDLVSQGDRYNTAISTPMSCSLQHDTSHLDMGRPEPQLASMCRGNPHQGIPSTNVTASHVTQGRAEYESTIPRGTA